MEIETIDNDYIIVEFEYDRYGDRYSKPRKLRGTWNPEALQDLQAYHAIDVEAELAALLAAEIGQEIDREMLNNIFNINNINHE